jgi:hypothetical protein
MTNRSGRSWLSRSGFVAGVAVALLGVAATPGVAGPAAARSDGECLSANTLCLFEGPNFTGERITLGSLVSPGTCVSLVDHGWGDRAHSAINTHSNWAAMFMNDDCLGGPNPVPGNSQIADFGAFTPESVWVPR